MGVNNRGIEKMAITDLGFIFVFLPVSLILYYISESRFKEHILIAVSIFFYACGSIKHLILLLVSMIINICISYYISRHKNLVGGGKIALLIGVAYNILILGGYKYLGFMPRNTIPPLGISFFTFKAISLLIDVYRNEIEVVNLKQAVLHMSFFAQIQSGPISRYNDMKRHQDLFNYGKEVWGDLTEGIYRFVVGFSKKILVANLLSNVTRGIFSIPFEANSTSLAWLGSVCYSLQLLFDFEGYSDMAIGISRMFGYYCPENFLHPYMTSSVSEFWRRWHVTLGAWFRDYVYIPLGGSKKGKGRLFINLLVVWLLTGIWHGAKWNFIFWGIVYFAVIFFEKTFDWPKKFKSRWGRFGYRIITLLFINLQWVIFNSYNLHNGLLYIRIMFVPERNGLADLRSAVLLKDYWIIILIAVFLCCPAKDWFCKKCKSEIVFKMGKLIYPIVLSILFVLSLSFIVSGQNNPFAYANF